MDATRWLSAPGRPADRRSCSCGWSFRGVGESSGGVTGCLRAFPCTEVPFVRVISIPACRSPLRVSPFRGLAEYLEFANWAFVIDGRPKTPKGAKTGSHEGDFCTNFWKTLARRGLLRRATPLPTGFGGREGRRIRREPYQMPRRSSRFSTKRLRSRSVKAEGPLVRPPARRAFFSSARMNRSESMVTVL